MDQVSSWMAFAQRPREQGGLGLPAHGAAGLVGNLINESGPNLNPWGPTGDNGTAWGTAQWRGDRLAALRQRPDYDTAEGQQAFMRQEFDGPENKAYRALTAATTPEEAATAVNSLYERSADRSGNRERAARSLFDNGGVSAINSALGMKPDPQPSGAAMAYDGTTPPPNDGFLGQLARFGGNASNGNYTLADALGNAGVSMMALDNAKGASALSTNMALTRKTQVPVKPAEYQYDAKSNTFFRTNPVTGALETTKNPNADEADKVNPDTIKAIIEGRAPYPANSRAADAVATREAVAAADPTFDAVNYNARLAARKDFTSGKSAQNLTSFNTAIGHLGTLDAAIDGLNNGASPAYNTVANAVAGQTNPDFAAAKSKFDIAKTAVADELTRAFRLSGGNVHDLEQWEQAINSAASPEALHAAVKQAAHLLDSRVQSVGDQYNRGMGTTKDPLELLNPKAAASFKTLLGADTPATPAATLAPTAPDRSAVEAEMRRRGLLK